MSDSSAGGGSLDLDFDQSDCSLSGTWQASFADASFDGSGTLTGSVDGGDLTISLLTEAPGSCDYRATGSLQGTAEIAGSYSTFGTSCSRSGTFDVLSQATPTAQPTATADATPTAEPTASASPTPTP
ncbi:MAG: hypothetical protein HYY35_07345 [Deltaproteobacteria bacterium]|nr:hypothetical protein [Deltaproteobacteria bacterium]